MVEVLALARKVKVQGHGVIFCYACESGMGHTQNLTIYVIPFRPHVPLWLLYSALAQFSTYDSTS